MNRAAQPSEERPNAPIKALLSRLAMFGLLVAALSIAASHGRVIETIIIAVLLVPTLIVLGAWVVSAWRPRKDRDG